MKKQVYEVKITKLLILTGLLILFWTLLNMLLSGWYHWVSFSYFLFSHFLVFGSMLLILLFSSKRMKGYEEE